ncbi:hypothetical protein BHM03_00062414 [Ensete ventricosum]|nr:hypothetical protein BHM03_00062414 [Ensete ventricosum]
MRWQCGGAAPLQWWTATHVLYIRTPTSVRLHALRVTSQAEELLEGELFITNGQNRLFKRQYNPFVREINEKEVKSQHLNDYNTPHLGFAAQGCLFVFLSSITMGNESLWAGVCGWLCLHIPGVCRKQSVTEREREREREREEIIWEGRLVAFACDCSFPRRKGREMICCCTQSLEPMAKHGILLCRLA